MGKNVGWSERGANRRPSGGRVQGKVETAIPAGQRDIRRARARTTLCAARHMQPSGHIRGKAHREVTRYN
jgi:hypothetical protein